jgi:hypothetical protein
MTIAAVGEINWIDLVYEENKQELDLSEYIEKAYEDFCNPPPPPPEPVKEENEGKGEEEESEAKDDPPAPEGEGEEEEAEKEPEIPNKVEQNLQILEYGPKFTEALLGKTKNCMKIFWDGSISLFPETEALDNNKVLVCEFLRIRELNEDLTEPIYTLAHGSDTQLAINTSFNRIKMEQLEAKDNQSEPSNDQSSM